MVRNPPTQTDGLGHFTGFDSKLQEFSACTEARSLSRQFHVINTLPNSAESKLGNFVSKGNYYYYFLKSLLYFSVIKNNRLHCWWGFKSWTGFGRKARQHSDPHVFKIKTMRWYMIGLCPISSGKNGSTSPQLNSFQFAHIIRTWSCTGVRALLGK